MQNPPNTSVRTVGRPRDSPWGLLLQRPQFPVRGRPVDFLFNAEPVCPKFDTQLRIAFYQERDHADLARSGRLLDNKSVVLTRSSHGVN
jgi:hypothetical protein